MTADEFFDYWPIGARKSIAFATTRGFGLVLLLPRTIRSNQIWQWSELHRLSQAL